VAIAVIVRKLSVQNVASQEIVLAAGGRNVLALWVWIDTSCAPGAKVVIAPNRSFVWNALHICENDLDSAPNVLNKLSTAELAQIAEELRRRELVKRWDEIFVWNVMDICENNLDTS
jgi:hypothetical protein